MTKQVEYKSLLAPYMDIMLNVRLSLGYSAQQMKYILKEFDDFVMSRDLRNPCISEEMIKEWRKGRVNDSETTIYHKFCVWRELAILMGRHGCECNIPRLPRYKPSSFTPYIYSKEEMKRIFEESDKLGNGKNYINAALMAIPVILRLLYSTGIASSKTKCNKKVALAERCRRSRSIARGCLHLSAREKKRPAIQIKEGRPKSP